HFFPLRQSGSIENSQPRHRNKPPNNPPCPDRGHSRKSWRSSVDRTKERIASDRALPSSLFRQTLWTPAKGTAAEICYRDWSTAEKLCVPLPYLFRCAARCPARTTRWHISDTASPLARNIAEPR